MRGPKPLPFPVLRRRVESRSSSLGQSFASTRRIDSASIQRRSRPSLIFELVEITVFTRARSCERALSSHLDPNHFAFVLCRRHRRRSTRARRRDAECGRVARPSPNQPSVGVARNFSAAAILFEDDLGFTISHCLPIRRRRRARARAFDRHIATDARCRRAVRRIARARTSRGLFPSSAPRRPRSRRARRRARRRRCSDRRRAGGSPRARRSTGRTRPRRSRRARSIRGKEVREIRIARSRARTSRAGASRCTRAR